MMLRNRGLSLSQASEEEPAKKRASVAEDDAARSNIPEYILSAITSFKEGREYSMAGNFQCAKNKFFSAVQNLMNEETKSPSNDHELPVGMTIKDIVDFVDRTRLKYFQKIRDFCSHPTTPNEASLICARPSRSHIDQMQSELGKKIMEGIDYSDLASLSKVKGIICAVLSDIISALSVCEQLLGNYDAHALLSAAENRLQKMLYGETVMRTAISLCNIDHCMDAMAPSQQSGDIEDDRDYGLGEDLGIGRLTPPKAVLLGKGDRCPSIDIEKVQHEGDEQIGNDTTMVYVMTQTPVFSFSCSSGNDNVSGIKLTQDSWNDDDDFAISFLTDFD